MHRVLRALNKPLGSIDDYYDEQGGGVRRTLGILPSDMYRGTDLSNARIAATLWDALEWRRLFKTVQIVGMETTDGEDVYVLKKTPSSGAPVTDYISAKTFLLRKREGPMGTVVYRKYAPVDKVMLPVEWTQEDDYLGTSTIRVTWTEMDSGRG